MSDTIRQQIVDAVDTQLKTIAVASGYQTNVGSNVHEWRIIAFDPSTLPAIIWRDLDEPNDRDTRYSERNKRSLHMQVEILATAPRDYRKIIADVERAVKLAQATDDEGARCWWNGLAYDTTPRISRLVVEQESRIIAGGFVEFFIHYITRDFDQYQ